MHCTKILLSFILFCWSAVVSGQKTAPTTQNFIVEGLVKRAITVDFQQLKQIQTTTLDSVVIKNHRGEKKSTLKNLKMAPLKAVLSAVEIDLEQPRLFSECYFVCVAADGYKIVFSWNELFNNPAGDAVYVIVEKNGISLENMEERIALIVPGDLMTGRRYVKGLSKIIVRRAE